MTFYPPPPTIISATGAQPSAGNKLPPQITAVEVDNPPFAWQQIPTWEPRRILPTLNGKVAHFLAPAVNNPPFIYLGRTAVQLAIISQTQPDQWQYDFLGTGFTGLQPYGRGQLPPSLLVVPNPPFQQYGSVDWLAGILQQWQLPNPLPIQKQPLSPGIPGQSVDFPPFVSEWIDQAQGEIVYSWAPADPLPTLPRKLSPGIPGQSVDNPPPTYEGRYPNPTPDVIARGWQPPDPLPTLPGRLSPGIPGQSVDNPPRLTHQQLPYQLPDPYPQVAVKAVQPFAASSLHFTSVWLNPVLASWQPIDPLPTLAKNLNPQITAVEVDNPPFGLLVTVIEPWLPEFLAQQPQFRAIQPGVTPPVQVAYAPHWLASVIQSWAPPDPLPTLARNLPPSLLIVPNPPPYARYWLASIIQSWQPPDPLPILPETLSPAIPGQSVDNPPSFSRQQPYPLSQDPLPQLPRLLPQPAAASIQVIYAPHWLATVIQSWQPLDPPATLARNLSPGIPGQSVDNPPGLTHQAAYPDQPFQLPQTLPLLPQAFASVVQVTYAPQWLASGFQAWIPLDPLPTLPRKLTPSLLIVPNPPFSSMGRGAVTAGLIQSWQPPDPQPTQRGPLNPQLTAVRVDNPPVTGFSPEFWSIIGTWDIPLPPQPQQTRYIVHIIPPPPPSKEVHDHPFFATFGKMTVH